MLYPADPVRTHEAVQEAFLRWGGIPRYVLEKVGDVSAQLDLERAFSPKNLELALKSVGELDTSSEACHRMLHITTSSPYVVTGLDFVSCEKSPLFAQLRGDCFEALAHEKLAAGGEFQVRELAPAGGVKNIRLSQATVRRFSGNKPGDLAVLCSFSVGDYCQPLIGTFPVVDAVVLPSTLLQMTVSWRHDVKEDTLEKILDALSLKTAELVFVVPPDKFYDFKEPLFKSESLRQRVTQKALCVSFDIVL
jgi:hypothetical protein